MFYCLLKGVFKNCSRIMIKANDKKLKKRDFYQSLYSVFRKIYFLNCLCFNLKYSDKKAIISREFGFMGFMRDTDE